MFYDTLDPYEYILKNGKKYRYSLVDITNGYYTYNVERHVFWFFWKYIGASEHTDYKECIRQVREVINKDSQS